MLFCYSGICFSASLVHSAKFVAQVSKDAQLKSYHPSLCLDVSHFKIGLISPAFLFSLSVSVHLCFFPAPFLLMLCGCFIYAKFNLRIYVFFPSLVCMVEIKLEDLDM